MLTYSRAFLTIVNLLCRLVTNDMRIHIQVQGHEAIQFCEGLLSYVKDKDELDDMKADLQEVKRYSTVFNFISNDHIHIK